MNDHDPIRAYPAEFSRRLAAHGAGGRRALEEIECHLRELADWLSMQGLEPEAAAKAAIERFGSPSEVMRQFELEAPIESEVNAMIRYLLRSVAVLTFVFGALFFILSWFDDAPPAMFTAKAAVSAIVMACSFILLFQVWVTQPHRWERELTLAVALISIMIGSAGAVWTVHLGLVTGDWEGYGFVVGGLILLQGVLAAVDALNAERPKQMA